jgi:hypothetical protein
MRPVGGVVDHQTGWSRSFIPHGCPRQGMPVCVVDYEVSYSR